MDGLETVAGIKKAGPKRKRMQKIVRNSNACLVSNRMQRDSNFELLRIVCMLMIVSHHFITQIYNGNTLINNSLLGSTINALCYVGVNCFILTSGWFRIKVNWKSFLNLFLCCSFYGLASYFFHLIKDDASIGKSLIKWAIFPLSGSKWWFVNCYLILYLCSPLINTALQHISRREHLTILCLLTICNVYFGNVMQADFFNQDGYSAAQFIYVYIIGDYLRRYTSAPRVRERRWQFLICYFVFAMLWLFHKMIRLKLGFSPFLSTGYNNVFNLCASVCFFLFMSSFCFKCRFVNYIAASAFSVYLLQESTYFGRGWLYPRIGELYDHLTVAGQIGAMLALSVSFFTIVTIFDQLRLLLNNSIIYLTDSFFKRK